MSRVMSSLRAGAAAALRHRRPLAERGGKGSSPEILRFAIVGLAAFAIDYGSLMLMVQLLGAAAAPAAALSFTLSLVFNYAASRSFVFRRDAGTGRAWEAASFIALSGVGLALNELIVHLGSRGLGHSPVALTVSKLFATAVVMVWNYATRKVLFERRT